jgi:hypothetical protein
MAILKNLNIPEGITINQEEIDKLYDDLDEIFKTLNKEPKDSNFFNSNLLDSLYAEFNSKSELFIREFQKKDWEPEDLVELKLKANNYLNKLKDFLREIHNSKLMSAYLYLKHLEITQISDKKNELINFIDENLELIKNQVEEVKISILKRKDQLNDIQKESKKLQETAIENVKKLEEEGRRLLKGKISETYKREFDVKSLKFEKISKRWRCWLYVSLIFLFIALFSSLIYEISSSEKIKDIQSSFLITKVSLLSVLAWLTLFFSKNYNNNKNLAYIYEQKHVMISTYLAFIDTISDEQVKNNLAGEIGKIIFDVVETGFIKVPQEPTPNIPSIVSNIFKTK